MKYEDYYGILGIERDATVSDVKKAYRKLAHKFHPDVSRDPAGEEKFKKISEAYQTLKDPQKRAAYDRLGHHQPGQDFRPSPDWETQFGGTNFSFDNIDLSDLFAAFGGSRQASARQDPRAPRAGQDHEVKAIISLKDAYKGALLDLNLSVPEYDEQGRLHRASRNFKVRIPRGATDGQKLRLTGKGGHGFNGGRDGDLYLNITLDPHPIYRVRDHDLYLDLPLSPWEAVLGASVEIPTPGGAVNLKIPPGTSAGRKFRIANRGLPRHRGEAGDLFAIVQIVLPKSVSEHERELFRELAKTASFKPRCHFEQEIAGDT